MIFTTRTNSTVKAKISQYSQIVFFDSLIRYSNESDHSVFYILCAIYVIVDIAIEILKIYQCFLYVTDTVNYKRVQIPKNRAFIVKSRRIASKCQSFVNSTSACLPSVLTSIRSVVISKFAFKFN
jgi:hypothetical protein